MHSLYFVRCQRTATGVLVVLLLLLGVGLFPRKSENAEETDKQLRNQVPVLQNTIFPILDICVIFS
jgi:hypothetical protein